MPLPTSADVPSSYRDDERLAASTTEREISSSDMEIDDDDDDGDGDAAGGEENFRGSFNWNDASNIMESNGHDGHLRSDASTSKTLYVGESNANFKFSNLPNEPLATQKEDPCTNYEGSKYPISGKQTAKEKATQENVVGVKDARAILERKALEDHHKFHTSSKNHFVVNEITDESTNPSSFVGKEVAIKEILLRYHSGGVNDLGFEENSKQMDVQMEDDRWRTKSRSAVPQTSTGSMSSDVEFNSGNKRPALICDFFARGWCIKGSSCRFLHIKDSKNNPRQQPEEDVASADGKRAVHLDEGFRSAAERSSSAGSMDILPLSVENKTALSSHSFPERTQPLGHTENQRVHPFPEISQFPLLQSKDKPMGTSSISQQFSASTVDLGPSKDVRQNGIGQNLPTSLNDRGSSTFRNGFLPEHISSVGASVTSVGNIYRENQSYRVSTWLASLPFDSSLNACSLDAQKVSDNDRERHTSRLSSLLQGSSPFSSSEPENFPANDIARDPLHFAEYRINISSNDWEPSVPFQPSFFVTSSISSPRSQYDPLRDSIDLSNARGRSLGFSFSSQGPSLPNVAYPPTYGDSTSMRLVVPECNGDKRTASSHDKYHDNLVNNNCNTSGKDSLTTVADDGTSAADVQNGALAKEEISSVASHVKDISKAKKIDTDRDDRHRKDGSRCNKDIKVDRAKEKDEIDVKQEVDGHVVKESKAFRHFHAALVDLIKELLKPTWREGLLSKDAHNAIVKKAVDKVLGTIQPHQIPATFESTKQYLALSQPKIARLVEGYIEKYRKS